MSKKNKRQHQHHTKSVQSTVKSHKLFKKPSVLTVFLCVCIVCCAIGGLFSIDALGLKTPKSHDAIAEYLQEKYQRKFVYVDAPMNCVLYQTNDETALEVAVYDVDSVRESMEASGYDVSVMGLHSNYADNGYRILYQEQIFDYYKQYITEPLGTHKFLINFNSSVLPGTWTGEQSYAAYMKNAPKYLRATFYAITDVKLTTEQCQAIKDSFDKCTHALNIVFIYAPTEEVQNYDLSLATLASAIEDQILMRASINYDTGWDEDAFTKYIETHFGTKCDCILHEDYREVILNEDASIFVYRSDDVKKIYPQFANHYTEPFVDNEYFITHKAEIRAHYKAIIQTVLPDVEVYTLAQTLAAPSPLTNDIPIADALVQYPDLFQPIILIITPHALSKSQCDALTASIANLNETIIVGVLCLSDEELKDATVEDLLEMWGYNYNLTFELQTKAKV